MGLSEYKVDGSERKPCWNNPNEKAAARLKRRQGAYKVIEGTRRPGSQNVRNGL